MGGRRLGHPILGGGHDGQYPVSLLQRERMDQRMEGQISEDQQGGGWQGGLRAGDHKNALPFLCPCKGTGINQWPKAYRTGEVNEDGKPIVKVRFYDAPCGICRTEELREWQKTPLKEKA